jgi:signal transduction histidine kinase
VKQTVQVVGYVNLVVFAVLAVVAFGQWRRRKDGAAAWLAAAFCALGVVVLLGQAVGSHPRGSALHVLQRLDIAVLLVFPYLLYRFTRAFGRHSRLLGRFVTATTTLLVVATFALPSVPQEGDPRPWWFWAYLAAFLVHWTVLSVIVALRLWRAGAREPTVARRRMHLLSFAAAAVTLALILASSSTDSNSPVALVGGLIGTASGIAFLLGIAPPRLVRIIWRRPEQERMQTAIGELMQLATNEEQVVGRVLSPMADIIGARAIAIQDADGRLVGSHNVPDALWHETASEAVEVDVPGLTLTVWTTPYAPFFGSEELAILQTLGSLTALALDRARLYSQEVEARIALERADDLKTNFIALAAHELRTPVTTIHGFVRTLNSLGNRLEEEQKQELRVALEQQTVRMASLVEQLLDLSRLDADAIEIAPEPLRVRQRIEDVVAAAAGERTSVVEIDAPAELEATVDPHAFDRIVSNLVTNAFRYGSPPVVVRAGRTPGLLHVAVEDRGPGVPPEFVPELFERFSRSDRAREGVTGTGLGLAIARSYARAHSGDLVYEQASPHGARFQLVLPSEPEVAAHRTLARR